MGETWSRPGCPHTGPARPGAKPRPLCVRLPSGSSRLLLLASGVFW
jgi:hypothetical protein